MNITTKTVCWLVIWLMPGCTDEDFELFPGLEVRLAAYDEMRVERDSFDANSEIMFGLTLVNRTSGDIEAGTYYNYCAIYQIDQFLLVYKMTISDTGTEKWQPVGKPYTPPLACAFIGIPVIVPANSERMVCGATWAKESRSLGPGRYYTALSHVLEVNGQTHHVNLRLDFEIH